MNKTNVAIIGTGNIGTDLLMKIRRSDCLECGLFAGRNMDSKGSRFAIEHGVKVTDRSINAIIDDPDCCEIVFDATSAKVHRANAPILKEMGKFVIDLTPARVGRMCIPAINLEECIRSDNVNMITCGGQATIPIAYALSRVHPETEYIEMVSTISSDSAGIGTRDNIDEFTQTTREALAQFTGIKKTKALIVLNPAYPPINMRSTVYAIIKNPDIEKITERVNRVAERVKQYVPGYHIIVGPVFENGRVTITVEVIGRGDYLPSHAGNLDIITCAAVEVAEQYVREKILKGE